MTHSLHTCPVCGHAHEVHFVLHRLAYGRQLTCSARCKLMFRALVLQQQASAEKIGARKA